MAGPQKFLLFRLLPYFYNQAAYLHWFEGDNENENGIDSDSDNDNSNNHSDNFNDNNSDKLLMISDNFQ